MRRWIIKKITKNVYFFLNILFVAIKQVSEVFR